MACPQHLSSVANFIVVRVLSDGDTYFIARFTGSRVTLLALNFSSEYHLLLMHVFSLAQRLERVKTPVPVNTSRVLLYVSHL